MGNLNHRIAVCIANRPPLPEFATLSDLRPIRPGEISIIAKQTGNHWRKIFNVYAKLAFQLNDEGFPTWQQLRDESLLQQGSPYALLFSPPRLDSKKIHVVAGKSYAGQLRLLDRLVWVDNWFAVHAPRQLILCPYFDYRQLSNDRIKVLVDLIGEVSLSS